MTIIDLSIYLFVFNMINNNENINNKSKSKDIMNTNINNLILQAKSKGQIYPNKKEKSFSYKNIIDYNKIKKINEPKNLRNINIKQYYINTNKITIFTHQNSLLLFPITRQISSD